jgi:hypothetical protein
MAVNYKPLNRNQEWGTDAKSAIRRLFGLAETAAAPSTSATISRKVVNRTLAGKVSAKEEQAFRTLFGGLRDAMDADNTSYDITPHVTNAAFSSARRTKIIKNMANEVIAMISAT